MGTKTSSLQTLAIRLKSARQSTIEREVTPNPAPSDLQKAQLDFLWKQHSYISDFIKFADAKCGFIASLNIGYIAILLSPVSRLRPLLPPHFTQIATITQSLASVSIFCLACSVFCAAWAVYPRLKTGPTIGPISWVEISAFSKAEAFIYAAMALGAEKAAELMARQVYYMSWICKKKNRFIQISLVFAACGACLSIGLMLLT